MQHHLSKCNHLFCYANCAVNNQQVPYLEYSLHNVLGTSKHYFANVSAIHVNVEVHPVSTLKFHKVRKYNDCPLKQCLIGCISWSQQQNGYM